ncbi:MAG: hypothetical protein IJZ03_04890 [Clostridia bacterium]|nr:hypothetical protein [Clostridia bacterium]
MKKLLALSLILVMILCSCSAPEKKENSEENKVKYTVYGESAWSDDGKNEHLFKEGAEKIVSYTFGVNKFHFTDTVTDSSNAPKQKTINIDGNDYELKLYDSYLNGGLSSSENTRLRSVGKFDRYRNTEGKFNTWAEFNHESGDLVFFMIHDDGVNNEADPSFNSDAAKSKADRLIKELYGENTLKAYTHYKTFEPNYDEYQPEYSVMYMRKVHGYETSETIMVRFNPDGSLNAINALSLGYFEGVEKEFTKNDVENAYKVLCDSLHDSWTNISKPELVIDTNGDYYICVYTSRPGNDGESSLQQFYINIK